MDKLSSIAEQNNSTLNFVDRKLESEFKTSYDKSVKKPLRFGLIISILSWYSGIPLIYLLIPEKASWLVPLTIIYIGSFFGFIIYATYIERFKGYYHLLGALSNAWAGLFAIYFCNQFPNGESLTLPVLIFIIFFGSYMVRLRWIAGFIAALSYIIAYHIYISVFSDIAFEHMMFYALVAWLTLIFNFFAGRVTETNNRISFIQRRTIKQQNLIISKEKDILLKEVHHRVKNNLQIISSLINFQLSKNTELSAQEALKETQNRVQSMALVHQRMKQSSDYSNISIQDYTEQLIDNIEQSNPNSSPTKNIIIDTKLTINIEKAIPFGLILNEIISSFYNETNLPHFEKKQFSIHVKCITDSVYELKYSDNGDRLSKHSGDYSECLELEIVEVLTHQLDGTFDFNTDNGMEYSIKLSL